MEIDEKVFITYILQSNNLEHCIGSLEQKRNDHQNWPKESSILQTKTSIWSTAEVKVWLVNFHVSVPTTIIKTNKRSSSRLDNLNNSLIFREGCMKQVWKQNFNMLIDTHCALHSSSWKPQWFWRLCVYTTNCHLSLTHVQICGVLCLKVMNFKSAITVPSLRKGGLC